MKLRISLVLLALGGCGQTRHDAAVQPESEQWLPVGGSASDPAEEPNAPPASCLYPLPGLELPGAEADAPERSFALSRAFPIDVAPATWSDLAATYDVNGDAISDLLFLDRAASPARFRLAVTSPKPAPFSHESRDCAALAQLPAGRLLLRDLNGDDVPDFVIGSDDGLRAFLNEPTGTRLVLSYVFPSPTDRAALLNLGAIDLSGDGRTDLVASFDRVERQAAADFTLMAVAFVQDEAGRFTERSTLRTRFRGATTPSGEGLYTGYLAVGGFGPQREPSAILVSHDEAHASTTLVQTTFRGDPQSLAVAGLSEDIQEVFSLPTRAGHAYLGAVGREAFHVVDLSQSPPQVLQSEPLLFAGGPSRELGGGAQRPRYFWYDLDRDGDLDFLERATHAQQLALHLNFDNLRFDAPQVFEAEVGSSAEAPFIQVGPGAGLVARPDPALPTAAVYALLPQ